MSLGPTGIELFAGCGGLSTGFLDAGLPIAAGFELDRRAVAAYDYNHSYRGSRGIVADLSQLSGAQLLEKAEIAFADMILGGPPCQPFSIVGKRKGAQDQRANLMAHYVRIVSEILPSAFLLENVPNLVSMDDGELLRGILTDLRELGYSVRFEVVSAVEFGVPQNRKRLIVLGLKGDRDVKFPEPTHDVKGKPPLTAKQALDDLPDASDFGECGIHNHEPTSHSPDMIARFGTLLPGTRERGSFHDRLHPERPSYTLRAGSGNFSPLRPVHYAYDRVITVRESARLQGFRDDFVWPDWIPRLQQYRQVGNAVPPPLAEAFALSIAHQLAWPLDPAGLSGDPDSRPPAITMSDDERRALRSARTRGASLGKAANSKSVCAE